MDKLLNNVNLRLEDAQTFTVLDSKSVHYYSSSSCSYDMILAIERIDY